MSNITHPLSESQENNPIDWRNIDVSTREGLRELDKVIFQRLNPEYVFIFEHEVGGIYGDEIYAYRAGIDDLDSACWDSVPAYSAYADCALSLLSEIEHGYRLEITPPYHGDGHIVRLRIVWRDVETIAPRLDVFADSFVTIALGISMCWLSYSDSLGGAQ